jgi:putative restriction endonuclease
MNIYRLSIVPSVADYVRGLSGLQVHDNQLRLFQTHYRVRQRTATATRLAELAGITGGHPVVNAHYGRLGHQFCDRICFEPDVRPDGTFRWWAMWSQGWSTPDGFVWEMLPQVAEAIELLGWVSPPGEALPEEVAVRGRLIEGSVCRVVVNAYERSPIARARCIAHYGAKCFVCDFDFGAAYGPIADGFIHVHHLKPLCEIGEAYEVDPVVDLRPVCANCHAVIHLGGGCRKVEELQRLVAAVRPSHNQTLQWIGPPERSL